MRWPWRFRTRGSRGLDQSDTGHTITSAQLRSNFVRGERALATGVERYSGAVVVVATGHLYLFTASGQLSLTKAWRQVNAGSWEPLTGTLTATWVDGGRPIQWTFASGGNGVAEAFHERVAASVVVAVPLEAGGRHIGQAAIRRDLISRELLPQLVWDRGRRAVAAEQEAYGQAVLADLCQQVGLRVPAAQTEQTAPADSAEQAAGAPETSDPSDLRE